MDKDLALLILNSCTQCTRELGGLAPLVKEHAGAEDYEHLKFAIGKSIHAIMSEIEDYVVARCPEAGAELERGVQRYGRKF